MTRCNYFLKYKKNKKHHYGVIVVESIPGKWLKGMRLWRRTGLTQTNRSLQGIVGAGPPPFHWAFNLEWMPVAWFSFHLSPLTPN